MLENLRERLFKLNHGIPFARHVVYKEMLDADHLKFSWKGMTADIKNIVFTKIRVR